MRKRAATTMEPTGSVVANAIVGAVEQSDLTALPKISSLNRTVQRAREIKRNAPAAPAKLEDLILVDEWTQTLRGDKFLFYDNHEKKRIIIFTTTSNLEYLMMCKHYYIDGTFKVAPPLFKQFYTIHGKQNKIIKNIFSILYFEVILF